MERTKMEMEHLVKVLNEANEAYYGDGHEIMSNQKYDSLYDRLERLERLGLTLSNSPTQCVGSTTKSTLEKVAHGSRMLSLKKSKDVEDLKSFLKDETGVLSWKLDGLTLVLTYEEGKLVQALTRGNGEIGEDVTHNAKVFENIPLTIPHDERLVIRGEAVISYEAFEEINAKLPDEEKYKNPRNLASGSVRQLSSDVAKSRRLRFVAFQLVESDLDVYSDFDDQLHFLSMIGFEVVEHEIVTRDMLEGVIQQFEDSVVNEFCPYPVDGLVLTFNAGSKRASIKSTSLKTADDGMAFKWQDEEMETTLLAIEWSPSKTGTLNPVAIFEPVELEGTTVSRASVHNVSILRGLKLGIGDRIKVYKANMIIPQISENLTMSNDLELAKTCPACGANTIVHEQNETVTLICPNSNCKAKVLGSLVHFASRDAMNIVGLSEETIRALLDANIIYGAFDLLTLPERGVLEQCAKIEGLGLKSAKKLMDAIVAARSTTLDRILYSLSIPLIGRTASKGIVAAYGELERQICRLGEEMLMEVEKIGPTAAQQFVAYFADEERRLNWLAITNVCNFSVAAAEIGTLLQGKTFVVTGSVEQFANRKALQEKIESLGGKVSGSVSKNTDYLVNNDKTSSSSKNKKAQSLGVAIISEEEFLSFIS